MVELPKLPTTSGLFTRIKARVGTFGKMKIGHFSDSADAIRLNKTYFVIENPEGSSNYPLKIAGSYFIYLMNTYPLNDNLRIFGSSSMRWKEGHFGTGGIYSDGKITINSAIVLNLPRQSTPPSNPSVDDIYFDDGTNTSDGKPHLRAWNGTAWEDI